MNLIFQGILEWLRQTYVEPVLRMFKVQAAIFYLEGIKGVRRVILQMVLLVFLITLIGAGLVLVPLALLLFMPWSPQTKAIVGLLIGLLYLLVPLVALIPLLSEKRWMKITGAQDVLKKLLD